MEKYSIFIIQLDNAKKRVREELNAVNAGKVKNKSASQLHAVLDELSAMAASLNKNNTVTLYYPKGIADCWDYNDSLGLELMQLANEYYKIKQV